MNNCPPGKIQRDSYYRKNGTKVKSTCVIDKGKPGKTVDSDKVLPIPKKGSLGKYGYYNILKTSATKRREAILKGVKDTSYATIIRRINLIANFNKSNEDLYKRLKSDILWMQKKLAVDYSKNALKATDNMTVVQLKELCKKKGKKGYSKLNKLELINLLKN